MAVAYEYTEEMKKQLNELRGDITAFRKLRRQFRKQLGLHGKTDKSDKEVKEEPAEVLNTEVKEEAVSVEQEVKVTSEGAEVEEAKAVVNGHVQTERTYTTDEGDVITVVA